MATGRGRERKTKPTRGKGLAALSLVLNGDDIGDVEGDSVTEHPVVTKLNRKPSGKKLAANKAPEFVEIKEYGPCLICQNLIKKSFCGTWQVFEKDDKNQDVLVEKYTCSPDCEKKKEGQPKYLGNTEIKWEKVTSFGVPTET